MARQSSVQLIDDERPAREPRADGRSVEAGRVAPAANRRATARGLDVHPSAVGVLGFCPRQAAVGKTSARLADLELAVSAAAVTAQAEHQVPSSQAHGVDVLAEKRLNPAALFEPLNELVVRTPKAESRCNAHQHLVLRQLPLRS